MRGKRIVICLMSATPVQSEAWRLFPLCRADFKVVRIAPLWVRRLWLEVLVPLHHRYGREPWHRASH
jgi:hypothetical protein